MGQSHCHQGDATDIRIRTLRSNIRAAAESTGTGISAIIETALKEEQSDLVKSQLPNLLSLKSNLRKIRLKNRLKESQDSTGVDLTKIPKCYSLTTSGDEFLLSNVDIGNGERILIYSTKTNLEFMTGCHLHADAIGSVTLKVFEQLVVFTAFKNGFSIPVVFIFLPNKQRTTYDKMWQEFVQLQPKLNPLSLMTDYEEVAMQSFSSHFPNVRFRSCFFHFSHSIWRSLNTFDALSAKLKKDPDFVFNIKKLMALAFVPPQDVASAFQFLCNTPYFTSHDEILSPFLESFEKTWIGSVTVIAGRTRRNEPTFPYHLWSVYIDIHENLPRTKSICEGYNENLHAQMFCDNITLFSIIQDLQKIQSNSEHQINKVIHGAEPPTKRKKLVECDEKMLLKVLGFNLSNNFVEIDQYLLDLTKYVEIQFYS